MNNYESYDIAKLCDMLKQILSENRYKHSLGVMGEMKKLAEHYNADIKKAELAGLLHDITKDRDINWHRKFLDKYNIKTDISISENEALLHAYTAEAVIKHEIGINDSEILLAVRYHTTARAGMGLIEKLLYVSDFTEPNRVYSDVDFYRQKAFEDLDKTMFLGIKWNLEDLLKKQKYIHINTLEAYNYFIKKIEI